MAFARFKAQLVMGPLCVVVLLTSGTGCGDGGSERVGEASSAVGAPGGGTIAFTGKRGRNWDIYVVKADGAGVRNLTRSRALECCPTWSPDGTKIAFMRARGKNVEIYVMNANGSRQRNLTRSRASDFVPTWSPDGKRIAFGRYASGRSFRAFGYIYVMNADGSRQRRLTTHDDCCPKWSPDGKKIAVINYFDDDRPLFAMNADGSGRVILGNPPYPWSYSWSPDGGRIAYGGDERAEPGSGDSGEYSAIVIVNGDGSGRRVLARNTIGGLDLGPTWAPDGGRIAFMHAHGGRVQISVVNAGGDGARKLTARGVNVLPAWSPDGEKIAFLGGSGKRWALRVMSADGTGQHKLAGRVLRPSPRGFFNPDIPETASPLMSMGPGEFLNDEPAWRPTPDRP